MLLMERTYAVAALGEKGDEQMGAKFIVIQELAFLKKKIKFSYERTQ